MAEGLIVGLANQLLSGTADVHDYTYMKLHVGAPGAAATANPAAETSRKQITWGTPSGGAMVSTTDLVWTSITGSEDATHMSIWDASTAGTPGITGAVTANPYTAGDTLTVPAGSVSTSFTVAS